jgi:hypothetical protein
MVILLINQLIIYIYKEKIQRSMEFAKINCLHVYIYYCREYNNNYKIIAQDNFFPFLPHSIVVSKPIAATSENQSPSQIF